MSIFTRHPYIKKYYIKHPIQFISHYFYDIKNAWQRANKGYCDKDLWNIDNWFLNIIPKMLTEFQKKTDGYPGNMTMEEWDNILSEMIKHFKNANEETCDFSNMYEKQYVDTVVKDFYHKNFEIEKEPDEDGFYTVDMSILPEHEEINKRYREIEDQREEYIEEELSKAFEMFIKYFHNLWW